MGGVCESCNSQGSVEILPHLGDYPIRDGPGMYPSNVTFLVVTFDEDSGAERDNCLWDKIERGGGGGGVSAGEEAHHKLVRRRAMEPPLEIGGK